MKEDFKLFPDLQANAVAFPYLLFSFVFIIPYNHLRLIHHRHHNHHPLFLVFSIQPFTLFIIAFISSSDTAAFVVDTVDTQ